MEKDGQADELVDTKTNVIGRHRGELINERGWQKEEGGETRETGGSVLYTQCIAGGCPGEPFGGTGGRGSRAKAPADPR